MLGFVLRGIVLVVVLGWYSTSVWKMIDGYFKSRFDNYLKEEFAKNPRMRADMAANREKVGVEVAEAPDFLDSCQLETCPVDKVEVLEKMSGAKEVLANQAEERVEKKKLSGNVASEGKRKIDASSTIEKKEPKRKKKRIKTITLTADDFEEVKRTMAIDDYDFTEFEYEDPVPEGILVSKLGFKPRADIGNLDRVTEEEFCPISLEYEGDCSETKTWP